MNHSFVTLMLGVVAAFGFGAGNVSAKGNGNSSNSSAPAPHHAAATTTVTPHLNGGTHYSSAMPYRATVSYRSGTRTLNYPAVGVSTLRHPTGSGGANFNNIAGATTVYPDWGRRRYEDRYIDVQVPQLPANSVVLVATWDPVAYFIPFAEPTAQYLGIENNYLELSQNNKLASEVKRVMRTPGRPKFVLSVNEFNSNELNSLLGHFGLRLGALPCQPIRSNLGRRHPLSLCPVAAE